MEKPQDEKTCPSCGSKNIEVLSKDKVVSIPLSNALSYKATIDRCRDCDMKGDFLRVNETQINSLLEQGKKSSMESLINGLVRNNGYSMAYMERAFDLAPRTMMRWKDGKFSDSALALIRITSTYPWIVEVADAQYNPTYAKKRLIEEGVQTYFEFAKDYDEIIGGTMKNAHGFVTVIAGTCLSQYSIDNNELYSNEKTQSSDLLAANG